MESMKQLNKLLHLASLEIDFSIGFLLDFE
jgi:hypothetical protein